LDEKQAKKVSEWIMMKPNKGEEQKSVMVGVRVRRVIDRHNMLNVNTLSFQSGLIWMKNRQKSVRVDNEKSG